MCRNVEGWFLGHGLICYAPSNYSGSCARQDSVSSLSATSSQFGVGQVAMENKSPVQKMLVSHVHTSDGSDMKLFFGRVLENECDIKWRRLGQRCEKDYSKPCPFGKSTRCGCNFSIAFHAPTCGRMVGKELGRHRA